MYKIILPGSSVRLRETKIDIKSCKKYSEFCTIEKGHL